MEERIACAECHLKLSKLSDGGNKEWWEHPLQADHRAVPVRHEPGDIIYVCDFCPTTHPRWVIPLMTHATTTRFNHILGVNVTAEDVDAWWMACDGCLPFVSAGDRKGLRDRALSVLLEYLGKDVLPEDYKQTVLLQLHAFWQGQPGPAVEANVLDD